MSVLEIQELQEILSVQSILTTVILVFVALILIGVFFDVVVVLFNKYIKKDGKNESKDSWIYKAIRKGLWT